MKISLKFCVICSTILVLFSSQLVLSANTGATMAVKSQKSVDQILDDLEKRFAGSGFSADFYQESPLPDIGVTESATGKAFFKKSEKFRWEYQSPDVLHYISDGSTLWIHSPDDNNVWIGEASTFFGQESSAGLLTDIKLIRKKFLVTLTDTISENNWELQLLPSGAATFGINKIFLSINKENGNISKIVSFNASNAETKITLSKYKFKVPSDTLFDFKIPNNSNIIPLDQ